MKFYCSSGRYLKGLFSVDIGIVTILMENSEDDSMHPNWVALATVKFKPKIFVKSTGTENQIVINGKNPENQIKIDNSSSEIYNEILQLPSTSASHNTKIKPIIKKKKRIEREKFIKENLFRSAQEDDAEKIRKILETSLNPDVNAVDAFGWTSLMIAACEGSANSFQTLLDYGADLNISDKTGNTALTLAEKKNFKNIIEIVENQTTTVEITEETECQDQGSQYCPDCGIEISNLASKSHQTSTVHLFSCKFKGNTNIKSFGISRTNRGYQMMRRTGWDGNSGLGSKKTGKLYPIRTVIRKRGTGLGIDQDSPKITHFKANDPSAVHFRPPPKMTDNDRVLEIIYKTERVADQILVNKQELVNWDIKRQSNREALRELKKSAEKKCWITVGSMLVQMETPRAIEVLSKEQNEIEKEINRLRDEQHVLVKQHKDLEMDEMPKGFDLKPMKQKEMNVLKNELKL
ncbi:CLUMA_CG013807, isoform A [Clunio marinus]|uniref:CLUMA_CG013807, isoform A n=1 Tax=Clunio marinus TaxID=568069 RepID=A0A1J1ILA6_9DIPT|nr:CLUMA_CG013807, isoform A [Clunio marinus]